MGVNLDATSLSEAGPGPGGTTGTAPSIRMEIHRHRSLPSRRIFRIIVSGTESSIPTAPQTHPQKIRDRKTTSVESPSRRPIHRGSTRLPMIMCIATKPIAVIVARATPNCTSASATGGTVAISEPRFGTKLRRNETTPQSSAKSTPSSESMSHATRPIATLR